MPVPSDKILEKELRAEVRALLDREIEITVNKVRTRVEERLDLPESFFKDSSKWKDHSKEVIHGAIQGDGSDEETKQEEDSSPTKQTAVKRQSSEEPEQKPKRLKKEPAPKKTVKKVVKRTAPKKAAPKKKKVALSESELSGLDESEEEEKPKKRGRKSAAKVESESELSDLDSEEEEYIKPTRKTAARAKTQKKTTLSDEDEEEVKSDPDSSATRKRKRPSKQTKVESDDEDDAAKTKSAITETIEVDDEGTSSGNLRAADSNEEEETKIATKPESESKPLTGDDSSELSSVIDDGPPQKKKPKKEESKPTVDDDSSDLSSVIDDGPPKKRKTKELKGSKGSAKPKVAKAAPKEVTGDEAEIKKLQGQLVKCGIRKIWAFELKEHGDDSRAKIRHLRKMLADAGLTGRFSEARAKEIKEQRELLADLGAVQEMNDLWGSSARSGRASRSKAPPKEESEEDDDAEDEKPRVSKRMADLAFLGSESESD